MLAVPRRLQGPQPITRKTKLGQDGGVSLSRKVETPRGRENVLIAWTLNLVSRLSPTFVVLLRRRDGEFSVFGWEVVY